MKRNTASRIVGEGCGWTILKQRKLSVYPRSRLHHEHQRRSHRGRNTCPSEVSSRHASVMTSTRCATFSWKWSMSTRTGSSTTRRSRRASSMEAHRASNWWLTATPSSASALGGTRSPRGVLAGTVRRTAGTMRQGGGHCASARRTLCVRRRVPCVQAVDTVHGGRPQTVGPSPAGKRGGEGLSRGGRRELKIFPCSTACVSCSSARVSRFTACVSRSCACVSRSCACVSRSCAWLSRSCAWLSRSCAWLSRSCAWLSRSCACVSRSCACVSRYTAWCVA
jgi:hypothetical protein